MINERKLLERGLKFVPTPNKVDNVEYSANIRNFQNKVRVKQQSMLGKLQGEEEGREERRKEEEAGNQGPQ